MRFPRFIIVGYSAKEQGKTAPMGIITFQWDAVNGEAVKLNSGFIVPSVTTVYSYDGDSMIPNWELNAPQIQIRRPDGGYTTRYYCADAYNNETGETVAGWATDGGDLDTTTELALGGGAWVTCASADCSFTTSGAVAASETAVGGDSTIMMLCGGAFPVSFKLNDASAVTWSLTAGTAYNHGENDEVTPNWEKSAPQIQVRNNLGGYAILYYADDMWDEAKEESVAGWGSADGLLDTTTTVEVGGGFWLKQPNGDKKIYVTVKNPIK